MHGNYVEITEKIPLKAVYDVIVAGGGVAGAAAAVSAARRGVRTLLIEKSVNLGGLATNGLVNFFVPMCNGRGKQIVTGLAEEFLRLSVRYGYDTLPPEWKDGEPETATNVRYVTRFSAPVFSLALAERLVQAGVDILYDTVVSRPVSTAPGRIDGLITESKSGREYYAARTFIDVTGDADILYRAGAPTVQGKNFFTYYGYAVNTDSMKKAAEAGDVSKAYFALNGGAATLYGTHQPEGERLYEGTSNTDITEYMLKNQLLALAEVKRQDRRRYDVVCLPAMAQLRTTRRIAGAYTLTERDRYVHHADSVGAICDFDNRDYLYEVPFRTLYNDALENVLTAGRCAAAEGYAWDVLRVIPPAILTGQAAGTAAALGVKTGTPPARIDVGALQKALEQDGVMLRFDDALVPEREASDTKADVGHI